ncbi:MAG: M3 family oligoendopeptidase, partial [Phycisphaerales bacterium]
MTIAIDTSFVPAGLKITTFADAEPYVKALLSRAVSSASELERWLIDRGELEAACSEAKAELYIEMTCDTEREESQKAYGKFVGEVQPLLTPAFFELDKRYVELAAKYPLAAERYGVADRSIRTDVALFRPENVDLEAQLSQLGQRFDQVVGAMTVRFEGREQPLPMMGRYQEVTDRSVREAAWRLVNERRMRDAEEIDGIYDQMIALRHQMAKNAGCADYVEYAFRAMHRFDYTPEECRRFHAGVETAVVPLVRDIERRRAATMGVESLRPWDLAVDVKGRQPLRPFDGGADLMLKAVGACQRLDPRLGAMLASLGDGANSRGPAGGACLDLDSRKGKAPGGYQYMRDRSRRPFIFMNSAGMLRDVETMVHEAGHAFHSLLCRDEPLLAYRQSPIEFAEVASMSMELLTMPHWGPSPDGGPSFFPNEAEFARACRENIQSSVTLLPWIATIDAFQLWVYQNPGHTHEQRTAY